MTRPEDLDARGRRLRAALAAVFVPKREGRRTMKRRVSSPQVPEPPPQTFSRCIQVGDQLFVAGITANSPTGIEGGDSMYEQALAVYRKIRHLVEAAGAPWTTSCGS
jgi:enamine deaminase RidA (YjgF/YER057c/UK114 family)